MSFLIVIELSSGSGQVSRNASQESLSSEHSLGDDQWLSQVLYVCNLLITYPLHISMFHISNHHLPLIFALYEQDCRLKLSYFMTRNESSLTFVRTQYQEMIKAFLFGDIHYLI